MRAPLVLDLRDDASEGDAHANAFSHRKLDVPVASLAISVVSARTLRSPIVGIGTELLAHREKIEVTRHGSPCARSPVPMGRAYPHCTRAVCALPRRMAQTWDSLAERNEFELPVPILELPDDTSR